jgi:hypothetical protein
MVQRRDQRRRAIYRALVTIVSVAMIFVVEEMVH